MDTLKRAVELCVGSIKNNANTTRKTKKQQEKFLILYDTTKKCLLILDHLYADLENCLASDAAKVDEDSSIVIKVNIAALGLIDYFHRFGEIVSATPFPKTLNI